MTLDMDRMTATARPRDIRHNDRSYQGKKENMTDHNGQVDDDDIDGDCQFVERAKHPRGSHAHSRQFLCQMILKKKQKADTERTQKEREKYIFEETGDSN